MLKKKLKMSSVVLKLLKEETCTRLIITFSVIITVRDH